MKFSELTINNFRNFHEISIELSNKNIIFGMNDVGKSNLIHAMRMLFDSKVRTSEILDTDFHKRNTADPIKITCKLLLEDMNNECEKKIISKVREARNENSSDFYIQLIIQSDNEGFNPNLYWGSNLDELLAIPARRLVRTELDDLFECFFIPAHVDIDKTFNDFKKQILSESKSDWANQDASTINDIQLKVKEANQLIAKLPSVENIQSLINSNLEKFDNSYKIKIASQQSVGSLHGQLSLFTHDIDVDDPPLYPTAGDGRRKKMMYAMLMHLVHHGQNDSNKIPILLIEEPENHLFLSAQVELSKTLFENDHVEYLFMVTHSPQLMYHLEENVRLIRVYKESATSVSKSGVVSIPQDYQKNKKILLENLAHCFFVERVLLVEGPSEKLLFDSVLNQIHSNNNSQLLQKIYVMVVGGAYFLDYFTLLCNLGIKVIVKTDNDIKTLTEKSIKKFSHFGLNRCINLYNGIVADLNQWLKKINSCQWQDSELSQLDNKECPELFSSKKKAIYASNQNIVQQLNAKNIFISEIDLEHDLAKVLNEADSFVDELQKKKWHHMHEFIVSKLTKNQCQIIYDASEFECLKRVCDE